MSKPKKAKAANVVKAVKPVQTPIELSVGKVATARTNLEHSVELLEKAQANARQAHAQLQAAEAARAEVMFAAIETAKASLMA
jgi:hypothetical protein